MSDEIVREFLVEGNENLDTLDRELVQLEKDPQNRATLASVFRTIHTIKGTCGFLGFTKLEAVAHVGENLLSRLRDLELLLNPDITTALLRMVDAVRQMMVSIEAIGNEGESNDEKLIKMLTRVQQGGSLEEGPAAARPATAPAAPGKHAKSAPPAAEAMGEKKHAHAPAPTEAPPQHAAAARRRRRRRRGRGRQDQSEEGREGGEDRTHGGRKSCAPRRERSAAGASSESCGCERGSQPRKRGR
jgi:two-component system chemotaxis sensor kinase CheA